MRNDLLVVGEHYHIFNKSIAEYIIFNNDSEFTRMINVIRYYQKAKPAIKFSDFIKLAEVKQNYPNIDISVPERDKLIEIITYCLMPTHIHLILKQLKKNGISIFMGNILNSYTRYFNTKHKRKGPLWEGKFKNILVETDEQLLHLTRYIHLNPATAYLVNKPEEWLWSSYKEYLLETKAKICRYDDILDIEPDSSYRKFVEGRIPYQRELAKIKDLTVEQS
ncbi:transposase [bacterium]|nr:transposase [bacterium]